MSSLPPGVTDSMCEGITEYCARCGHEAEIHLDDDTMVCDKIGCGCEKYIEGEYEPEMSDDDS